MFLRKDNNVSLQFRAYPLLLHLLLAYALMFLSSLPANLSSRKSKGHVTEEDFGLLVQVGFDITAFRPPAYQRGSLPRPSKEVSS